jgi:hypothetical protein
MSSDIEDAERASAQMAQDRPRTVPDRTQSFGNASGTLRSVYCPSGRYATAEPFGGMHGMVARTPSGAQAAISGYKTRVFGRKSADLALRRKERWSHLSSDGYITGRARSSQEHSTCFGREDGAGMRETASAVS